ncbi:hypothetical protein FGG08_003077 [Glutinoglossum americanum]|uniref:Glycerophosphocholine acyltransferase 1 n=1 Tax=Glutinoglossum americanum TaxID=1670608 RepID=A0A9P8HZ47_9PEZI|nr:hypothetical protein FGG08_003077 [Glutinoglossum americanum]
MSGTINMQKSEPEPNPGHDTLSAPDMSRTPTNESSSSIDEATPTSSIKTPNIFSSSPSSPLLAPQLTRNSSFSGSSSFQEDWDAFPPLDRLTVFDILDNLALPQRLERLQNKLSMQTEKMRRHRERIKMSGNNVKDRVVEEWRRRIPPSADEQLEKYRKKMNSSVERLGQRWNDAKVVSTREKVAFIAGVLNIFISGYLIGAYPDWFHIWYTVQFVYFMPLRYYTYHKRGYHYFLADLCYFVNVLALLSIWIFPNSKRLFISTYCLAFGNNAWAIAMWRNSMVFHSIDKVTSLMIHIMPPVTLHCMVHRIEPLMQQARFPAIYTIKYSSPNSKEHYSLVSMVLWATLPYLLWQLSYHFFITMRRRAQIAAGRPTSFTWLRKSYSKKWIGRLVLSLPESFQEFAFMLIQYIYAVLTMLPCPLWFWYRWPSAVFLFALFVWSIYNGATYYIDVFGTRFQKELELLKSDVAKWQSSPEVRTSPPLAPSAIKTEPGDSPAPQPLGPGATGGIHETPVDSSGVDHIPLLDGKDGATGTDVGEARERKKTVA